MSNVEKDFSYSYSQMDHKQCSMVCWLNSII